MSNLCMLRHRKVLQDSAGSYDTILQVFHAETFQVLRLKVLQQLLTGGGFRKYPVVKLEVKNLLPKFPQTSGVCHARKESLSERSCSTVCPHSQKGLPQ